MRLSRLLGTLAATGLSFAALVAPAGTAQAADAFSVTTLHFAVKVGPANNIACDIIGDLYVPNSASPTSRVPAILTTNGFGGSKDDQAGIGKAFANRGYAVLSYSGLGFGGSDCKITLDDPDYDGKAAQQLVSYLGGKSGVAFTDDAHTTPAPVLDVVERDGPPTAHDPRVGMVGGSYGGQVQFAAAGVDQRIDTIVPLITWNDLAYSMVPNNTSQTLPALDGVSTNTPGAAKATWALGFYGLGVANGVENAPTDPGRLLGCPNFITFVCPTLVYAATTGTLTTYQTNHLRHASVTSYISKIKAPTLIIQGQSDTLFNLNEGVANYRALKAQGTPTKMIWMNGGHSGPAAPGELETGSPDPAAQYVTGRIADWLDHYLKGAAVDTGPKFSYFRDWVSYSGVATPAYADSSKYPAGTPTPYYLSDTKLVTDQSQIATGKQSFLTPPGGLPSSFDELDAVRSLPLPPIPLPEQDLPGTFATYTTAPTTANVDVVGSPKLTLKVDAPTAVASQGLNPGKLVLFMKVLDVDSTGKATLIRNLVAPVRVPDVRQPFTVTMPAFVHRFEPGHSIRLVVAGGSTNYRGGLSPTPVSIPTGSSTQVLKLPVVP
jgi:ABC-2 type transport system ATP-binding protein